MYGKIFQTLFTGSLYGRFEATVTHIACIVLSDRDGYLNYTPAALAGATGFPLEVIEKGLAELQQPDIRSRSKEHEGRRVIPVEPGSENGWFVVNKAQYRDMQDPDSIREQTRERVRRHREKRSVTPGNDPQRHTDTNPDTDSSKDNTGRQAGRFTDFWKAYPKKVKRKTSEEIWKLKNLDPMADKLLEDIKVRLDEDLRWKKGFVPDPTTYLRQERWNDEISQ